VEEAQYSDAVTGEVLHLWRVETWLAENAVSAEDRQMWEDAEKRTLNRSE